MSSICLCVRMCVLVCGCALCAYVYLFVLRWPITVGSFLQSCLKRRLKYARACRCFISQRTFRCAKYFFSQDKNDDLMVFQFVKTVSLTHGINYVNCHVCVCVCMCIESECARTVTSFWAPSLSSSSHGLHEGWRGKAWEEGTYVRSRKQAHSESNCNNMLPYCHFVYGIKRR